MKLTEEEIQKCSTFMVIEHSAKELITMLESVSEAELLGKSLYIEWLTLLANNAKNRKEHFLNKLGERDENHSN